MEEPVRALSLTSTQIDDRPRRKIMEHFADMVFHLQNSSLSVGAKEKVFALISEAALIVNENR